MVKERVEAANGTSELASAGGIGENDTTEENGSRNKRKAEEMKGKVTKKARMKVKKGTYEKCTAFLCQEPPVDESTGRLNWVQCDSCNNWYHWDCVGMLREPTGNFFCGCDKILYSDSTPTIFGINCNDARLRSSLKRRLSHIGSSKLASKRADLLKGICAGRRKMRKELQNLNECCPFTGRQINCLLDLCRSICAELWPKFDITNSHTNFSYVTDVLLPEASVYFIQKEKKCHRNTAEEIFNKTNGPDSSESEDE